MRCNYCGNEWLGLVNKNLGSYVKCPHCSNVFFIPPPMPVSKKEKQHTVLSVRDLAILYNVVNDKMLRLEIQANDAATKYLDNQQNPSSVRLAYVDKEEKKHILAEDLQYQDLLRIRDKFGELNVEIEAPIVEVEE